MAEDVGAVVRTIYTDRLIVLLSIAQERIIEDQGEIEGWNKQEKLLRAVEKIFREHEANNADKLILTSGLLVSLMSIFFESALEGLQ